MKHHVLTDENGRSLDSQKSPVVKLLSLCVQRQAAAVGVFLGFFLAGLVGS